ncbi:F0F1 ATP synthase subunit gamma [Kineosporia sp. R_H_3]|uniref:F0F1 ATP synthase subunit gamma n=1 Tax=Kineosporia sp. R_H_3 TaxID=1961848 RepID=UPI000B4BD00F|nr:F0F1 ATP synthase subunit gamma [Kineosporia sp. R_H_3]
MGAQLRVYRSRIKAVQGTKKITRAFELIAASRMVKAQQRTAASAPYARAITRAVSAVATYSNEDHPLTTEKREVTRAAMLLVTSDRGLAGAYSSNVIKEGERLAELLRGEGKEVVPFIAGRKGSSYYRFRRRSVEAEWAGFSDAPQFENAKEIADALIDAFLRPTEEGGVDEIHVVSTRFVNMVTQTPEVVRLLPLEVVEGDEPPAPDDVLPLYEFEPSAAAVLDALLPKYVESRIFNALLQSAASELAARQRAMKSATDNAEELIKRYTRLANTARQAEITQEISEIVGGANALADASASA